MGNEPEADGHKPAARRLQPRGYRPWWDVSPEGFDDPDRRVPRRPTRHDLRYDRRVQLIAAGAALALLAVVLVGVGRWHGREPTGVPDTPGQAKSAAQAALGYLTALSEGDASGLLAYLAKPPPSTALITDDVLAESLRLNPITDITVLDSAKDYDRTMVTVQYRIGPTRVIDTFSVEKSDDGFWRVSSKTGFLEVNLPKGAVAVGLTLNGTPVGPDSYAYLVPGTYQVGSTNPLLTSTKTFVLARLSPGSDEEEAFGPNLGLSTLDGLVSLSPDGQQKVTETVATTVAQCLGEAKIATSCGLTFSHIFYEGRGTPTESTLRWTVEPGSTDLAQTRPQTGWMQPWTGCLKDSPPKFWASWRSSAFERVEVHARATTSTGVAVDYTDSLFSYLVDLTDPDQLVVYLSWSGSDSSCPVESP